MAEKRGNPFPACAKNRTPIDHPVALRLYKFYSSGKIVK
jgi:hypothetical protein